MTHPWRYPPSTKPLTVEEMQSEIDSSEIKDPFIEFGEDAAKGVLKALNLYEDLESVTDDRDPTSE